MGTLDVDPAVAAELRRILSAVDDMGRRLTAITPANRPITSGTLEAADDALPNARFVPIDAVQALSSALDHLGAWRSVVNWGLLPIEAHMTLLRAALEGAVRCRWLVDRSADSRMRVARGYAAQRDDYRRRRQFEGSPEGSGSDQFEFGEDEVQQASPAKSAADRLVELDGWQSETAIPRVPFEDITKLMREYKLERLFHLMSAAAHGKEWALAATNLDPSPIDAADRPGVGHGMVSANERVSLALTRIALAAVGRALGDLEQYGSAPIRPEVA